VFVVANERRGEERMNVAYMHVFWVIIITINI